MDGLEVPDRDVLDAPQQPGRQVSVPVEADFILAYSTVPGYYSWRNKDRGSWFIQSVVEVFNKYYYHMDILQTLTKVCAMVSDYKSENQKALNKRQVPSTVSMLRKGLYFFPEKVTQSSNKADDTNPSMTPPKSTCIISWKSQNPWDIEEHLKEKNTAQDQSCHLDFKLLGICNYSTQNLTARNFLGSFILLMFPMKVAGIVLIEARGNPLPPALSDSPVNER